MTRHLYSIFAALAAKAWLAGSSPTKRAAVTSCLSEANVPFVTRDSSLWTQNLAHFNSRLNYEPIAVAVPVTTAQVADAVKCGEKNCLAVTAKSGGHSFTSLGLGGEDGHLVIQLDRMYSVELNQYDNTAKIQPGARLGHVDVELYKQGKRALSHGYCPGVGIGGHAAHGGYGMVSRKYGLTLDAVKGATVVLYDGTIVHSSKTERPDLFWALRGAGSSFGIITEFEVNTFPAPKEVTNFGFSLDLDQDTAPEGLLAVQRFAETMPSEISAQIDVRATGYSFNGSYVGDEASLRRVLRPLLKRFDVQLVATTGSWIEYAEFWGAGPSALQPDIDITSPTYNESLPIYTTGAVTPGLSIKQFKSLSKYIATKIQQSGPSWSIQMFISGGQSSAITKPKNTDTAYAHRDQLLIFQYTDVILDKKFPPAGFSLGEGLVKIITEGFSDGEWGMYPNVPDSQLSTSEAEKLYWGGNLERLRVLKTEYDPKNVFRSPQSVQPLN